MNILTTITDIHSWSQAARTHGDRIGFVPTMGCLHEGHCALLRRARTECGRVALSIFVNPTQFGLNEDFARYPRTLEADLKKARACGVDVVFHPSVEEMYPTSARPEPVEGRSQTWFDGLASTDLCTQLCGKFRPGHFRGVATVVAKLLDAVQPHRAYFGEKDFQQLQIIRRMAADLKIPVEIVGCPIVREADGLAMSSRNTYLSPADRKRALALHQALLATQGLARSGCTDPKAITQTASDIVRVATDRIDYVSLCTAQDLKPLQEWKTPAVLAIAAWIGTTRLIDNVIFP